MDEHDRSLIMIGDDFGLTPGVCVAILKAHDRGILTTASVLANGPALHSYASALGASGMAAGAHLALVGEDRPILSAAEVPSLVDTNGHFPLTWREFLIRSTQGRVDRDDIEREFSAQIEALISAGIGLTHVDTHQHLHLWPQVGSAVIKTAQLHGIRAIRSPTSERLDPRSLAIRTLARFAQHRSDRAGLWSAKAAAGLDGAGQVATAALVSNIEQLARSGASTCEMWMHPGIADDPARARYQWNYRWSDELEALCSADARAAVQRSGLQLRTYTQAMGVAL